VTYRETVPDPLWEQQARQWAQLKPPLRPSDEDIAVAQRVVDDWGLVHRRAPRALVLGATPELASLRWPEASHVVAVDLSSVMLRHVWLPAPWAPGRRGAIRGQWLQLPYPRQSVDLILGHGSFSLVRHADASALAGSIHQVMRSDGRLVLRAYVRPSPHVPPEQVWHEMTAGRIRGFTEFKLRLLMALQRDGEVRVADGWEFFRQHVESLEAFATRTGWSIDEVSTISAYKNQTSIYWFPDLPELRSVLHAGFVEEECVMPSYSFGYACPTFVLRPSRAGM
jgi:SAM-dependent methyltransferase